MCTAISSLGKHHLFGRTLDLERSYGEAVALSPRGFDFAYKYLSRATAGYAIIGIAHVSDGIPLYYDATNEHSLCAAALNFPKSAVYRQPIVGKKNLASYELIPFVLQHCKDTREVCQLLSEVNLTSDSFSPTLPSTPLHWLFADRQGAIVAEPLKNGLEISQDPFRVLTNEPEFSYHQKHVSSFMHLSASTPQNLLCPSVTISPFSQGTGAIGLPGDHSSASRFIRAVFSKSHTSGEQEISRFFHVMDTVSVPLGCVVTDGGKSVCTVYTSCADADTLTYYFTTYSCRRIRAVRLTEAAKDSKLVTVFPINKDEDILYHDQTPPHII